MKYLSRRAVVLAFAVALLSAPVHAASTQRTHAAPASQSLAARLGAAWTELTHFFAATIGQPASGKGLATDGGSCIDPNGCGQAQLLRRP